MLPRSQPVIRFLIAMLSLGLLGDGPSLSSDEPAPQTISAESRELFLKQVQPLLAKACGNCHGQEPVDNELDLTATEFRLLAALLRHPGKVYTREELIERAYTDSRFVSDRTIDSHLRNVRAKLRDLGADQIETVHGVGYRLRQDG